MNVLGYTQDKSMLNQDYSRLKNSHKKAPALKAWKTHKGCQDQGWASGQVQGRASGQIQG